jgi:hypothetical protein
MMFWWLPDLPDEAMRCVTPNSLISVLESDGTCIYVFAERKIEISNIDRDIIFPYVRRVGRSSLRNKAPSADGVHSIS